MKNLEMMCSMNRSTLEDRVNPKLYAQELIHQFNITEPPIDVKKIIADLKIRYREEELGLIDCDGSLLRNGNKAIIIVNSSVVHVSRRNFTAAHELGHYCIKGHDCEEYNCSKSDMESFSLANKRIETEANLFAAELLMPEQIFRKATNNMPYTFEIIERIAEMFDVSLSAAAIRYIEFTLEKYAVIFSINNKIAWTKASKSFKYELRSRELSSHSYAYDAFNPGIPLPDKYEQIYPYAWIIDPGVPDDLNVQEHSIYFKNMNAVLTLIKIVLPEEEEDLYEE